MSKVHETLTPDLQRWIAAQHVFFVATAPSGPQGHINCSPKGGDSFRILGGREAAYLDLTGSGIETAAHVRENGRIVVMFCAFEGPPKIVRLHGHGEVLDLAHPRFELLSPLFPPTPGARAIIRIDVTRISDSCGLAVPFFQFTGPRNGLAEWAAARSPEDLEAYRRRKNAASIDGLGAWTV